MSKTESKREILKDKVVELVKEFIKTEGGISPYDLEVLFGSISPISEFNEVATTLGQAHVSLQ
ncbi:MAG: hypothetical protein ACLQUW_15850 [Desulfobaccales bacterium]